MSSQIGHRSFYPVPRSSLKSSSRPRPYLSQAYGSWPQVPSGQPATMSTPALSSAASCPNGIPLPPTPHVHFPPSPGMCQTFLAYSRREYDRTAIIVTAPSECALPARGCPGRTHYPIAVSSSPSYPPCTSERAGRRTERCQTPGPSRSSSRNRTQCAPIGQISPPPSPSYYAPHIFYTAEDLASHFKDSPAPSPSPCPTPPLLSDHSLSSSSDDQSSPSDTPPSPSPAYGSSSFSNLNYLFPEFANQIPVSSNSSSSSSGRAHHNHIGLDTGANSVFAITNALNGLSIGGDAHVSVPTKKKKSVRISSAPSTSSPSLKEPAGEYFSRPHPSTSPKRTKPRRGSRTDVGSPGCLDGF